jgi:hypothetical protein
MNKEEYEAWKNHPLTQAFHRYLLDYRLDLMERWARGFLAGDDGLMALARAQMAADLVSLDDDSISKFYGNQKEEVNE